MKEGICKSWKRKLNWKLKLEKVVKQGNVDKIAKVHMIPSSTATFPVLNVSGMYGIPGRHAVAYVANLQLFS